jgi:formate hydrogenlyase transcriptional activator
MDRILYIDDEKDNLITFEATFNRFFDVYTSTKPSEAAKIIKSNQIKVLITDQRMPVITGLELAQNISKDFPWVSIILLTAFADSEVVMKAVNQGGIFKYVLKPWKIDDLKQTIINALESTALRKKNINLLNSLLKQNKKLQKSNSEISELKNQLEEENKQLKQVYAENIDFEEIIGKSSLMQDIMNQVKQAAQSDSTILLLGESGTGKELFANAIHRLSTRSSKILVKINCGAIPENLLESELFGYEKGAFTGANKLKYGKIELAHNGTLFLDEIGELPLSLQPKLLRVLQESEIERLGGNKIIKTNFRLVAATNRKLEKATENGEFRQDLFYRLNILPIQLPPLRAHKEDIPQLIDYFVAKLNKRMGKKITSISKKSMDKLMNYHWPGNVRELENVIERAYVLTSGTKLQIDTWFNTSAPQSDSLTITSLAANEKKHILKALKHTEWRIRGKNGAAQILEINPTTLESRMKKLGIERPK